jgi:hypothetical protein
MKIYGFLSVILKVRPSYARMSWFRCYVAIIRILFRLERVEKEREGP